MISGSRNWPFEHSDLIHQVLDKLPKRAVIVHGACPTGVDAYAEDWVQVNRNGDADRFPALWRKNGIGAGHIRNLQMLDHIRKDGKALVLCFFWDAMHSPGTMGMALLALKAGVPMICYEFNGNGGDNPCLDVIDKSQLTSLRR